MKIIFCNSFPTSRLFGEKVDAWWYAKHVAEAEFWDISPLFFTQEKLDSFYAGAPDYRYLGPNHRLFATWQELESAVEQNRQSLLWYFARFDRMHNDDRWIRLLNSHHIRYFFQHFDPYERTSVSCSDWLRNRARMVKQHWHARYCSPRGIVTSGTAGRRQVHARYPGSNVISIPSVKVLWLQEAEPQNEKYVTFVDESIALDPDSQLGTGGLSFDVPGYYSRMRDMFSRIEDTLGIPVRIGCSGKYIYPDPQETFGGREVAYGKTLEWVHSSILSIGHSSLALDQAIVSRRPVLLVADSASTPYYRKIAAVAIKHFRQQPVLNTEIGPLHIKAALEQRLDHYEGVERAYFREPGVNGDYRRLCLDGFLAYA